MYFSDSEPPNLRHRPGTGILEALLWASSPIGIGTLRFTLAIALLPTKITLSTRDACGSRAGVLISPFAPLQTECENLLDPVCISASNLLAQRFGSSRHGCVSERSRASLKTLAIDEDQSKDSERRHTSEQVAYFIIDPPIENGVAQTSMETHLGEFASLNRMLIGPGVDRMFQWMGNTAMTDQYSWQSKIPDRSNTPQMVAEPTTIDQFIPTSDPLEFREETLRLTSPEAQPSVFEVMDLTFAELDTPKLGRRLSDGWR